MIIISHRGFWREKEEKNSSTAFDRSFSLNFGTETDIRDFNGDLVISHDIANKTCLTLTEFLKIYKSKNTNLPLALNIKSDGLHKKLYNFLKAHSILNYFVFDMSIPDTIMYLEEDMNVLLDKVNTNLIHLFMKELQESGWMPLKVYGTQKNWFKSILIMEKK